MRADMGSVNPVIAPQLPDLLEGRRRDLDTRQAEARMEKSRRFVKAERDLRDRVTKLHERLNDTRREQSLVPDHIERAVRTALRLADKPDLEPVSLSGAPDDTVFRMPPLSGSWSRCLEGLEHPYTQKIRPITFDHDVAKGRDDVVLVHLNHRLVQMSLSKRVWPGSRRNESRNCARSRNATPTPLSTPSRWPSCCWCQAPSRRSSADEQRS